MNDFPKRRNLIDGLQFNITSPTPILHKDGQELTAIERVRNIADGFSNAANDVISASMKINDGSFNNSKLKLGISDNNLNSSQYYLDMITFDRGTIIAMYHDSWVFRRIVDRVAQDMWSNGIVINTDLEADKVKLVYKKLSRLRSQLIYATQQARLFGGAASIIMVDDGEQDLSQPLNLQNIRPDSIIRLETTDRWYGLDQSTEIVTDYRSIDFGKPKYYTFYLDNKVGGGTSVKVHHSRILRHTNRRTVKMLEVRLQGWGISELEHIYQTLLAHDTTNSASVSLVSKALLEIVKVSGMRGMMSGLSMGSTNAQAQLSGQLAAINNYRNLNNLVLMDKDDEYDRKEYSFTGLKELLENQQDLIAGAAEMPKILLYGDSKGGISSDSPEMEFYAGTILGKQDLEIRPVLDKLLPIIFKVCGLEIPQQLDYDFVSIAGLSQDKKTNLLSTTVSAIQSLVSEGIMSKQTALEEIKQISDMTGFGTNICERDEELAKAMDEQKPEEESEGPFGGDMIEESQQPVVDNDYEEAKQEAINKTRKIFDFKRRK